MKEYTPVKEGKVREIYDIGDCRSWSLLTASPPLMSF